jgi:hypothetical protein
MDEKCDSTQSTNNDFNLLRKESNITNTKRIVRHGKLMFLIQQMGKLIW